MKNHANKSDSRAAGTVQETRSGVRQALLDLLGTRPELASKFGHFQAAFADQGLVPERLLEICRLRIDALHGLTAAPAAAVETSDAARIQAGDFSTLSVIDVASLALAEQMAIDAHGVSADQIADLGTALGEPGAVTLLTAIALFDSNARMQRVLQPLRERRQATAD